MAKPGEVRKAKVIGGDGIPKQRFVLVLSHPIQGTTNVILLTISSRIQNARPDDVTLADPAELRQAGLYKPSYISTSYVVTMAEHDLSSSVGTLTPAKLKEVLTKFFAHMPRP